MKKNLVCALLFAVMAGSVFTGCGDGVGEIGLIIEEEEAQQPVSVAVQPVNAAPEQAEQGPRLVYNTGKLTEAEEQTALKTMQTMYRNLGLEEYLGEGIHDISSEEWMETFGIGLVEGSRTYYFQEDGETLLTVQVGYNIEGQAVSNVFYQNESGDIILLKQEGSITQLIIASTADGQYDGDYSLWRFNGETGEIRHEEGTYAAGVIVGEYTVAVKEGTAASAAFDLWNNREGMEYVKTVLKYDDKGELIPEATPTPTAAPKPTATPTAAPKPTATPAATPKPAVNPAPTPTPAPEPEPEPDDDDDYYDGGGSDNNDDGGNDNDTPGSGGSDDSSSGGSSGGADVDIEWSGDIL